MLYYTLDVTYLVVASASSLILMICLFSSSSSSFSLFFAGEKNCEAWVFTGCSESSIECDDFCDGYVKHYVFSILRSRITHMRSVVGHAEAGVNLNQSLFPFCLLAALATNEKHWHLFTLLFIRLPLLEDHPFL